MNRTITVTGTGKLKLRPDRTVVSLSLKAADMLLIPSFSEAAPMVIGEAASLGTPILTTRTSSAEERVRFSGYGWVCENSQSGICKGIKKILECPAMLHTCAAFLQNSIFSNENAIKEFESIV